MLRGLYPSGLADVAVGGFLRLINGSEQNVLICGHWRLWLLLLAAPALEELHFPKELQGGLQR